MGVRVEQGGFEPEAALRVGAAEDGVAVVEEGAADGGDLLVVGVGGAEQHGAEGGPCMEGEGGVVVDLLGEGVGEVADLVDEGAESVAAERAEGDGHLEGVGAAGGAQAAAEEVGEAGFGVVVGVEVVGGVLEGVEAAGAVDGEDLKRRRVASRVCAGRG